MSDVQLYVIILTALVGVLGALLFWKSRNSSGDSRSQGSSGAAPRRRAAVPIRDEDGQIMQLEGGPRGRRGGPRLRRTVAPVAAQVEPDLDSDNDVENEDGVLAGDDDKSLAKLGKKKAEKLQAKAEKKLEREAFQKELEEKKKQKEKEDEEARKDAEKEKAAEAQREEEERKKREEKERREHEEYLALKASFAVEEEGFDEDPVEGGGEENKLQTFIQYIKETKVVLLEDLAAHFKMKTQDTIDRVTKLSSEGLLSGVIDDRGKFIYISQQELEAVAKFVKQRGRVSISELAENSNKLIAINTTT